MAFLVCTCPHCETKNVTLQVMAIKTLGSHEGYVYLDCSHCGLPSAARIHSDGRKAALSQAMGAHQSLNSFEYSISAMWPGRAEPQIPNHIPEAVKKVLLQAESNFSMVDHEDAAGVMYRKALELALKQIDSDLTGMLASRIRQLGEKGKLTKELVEWANEIKTLGNNSAHDEESITRSELEDLRGLVDMVLRYLFTLPTMTAIRRSKGQRPTA